MVDHPDSTSSGTRTCRFWLLAMLLLVVSGIAYRVVAGRMQTVAGTRIELPIPLSEFPMEVGKWVGKDVPMSKTVQKVAGNDDFFSRLYINETTGEWASIYVAYTARPRTMLGHRPQVCYRAHGWVHDGTDNITTALASGREIPCLLHRFHRSGPSRDETVVLNFYLLNGKITDDESSFDGVGWRTPNIAGNIARYAAQVQISSVLENSVRSAAREFSELIVEYFPDERGVVWIAEKRDAGVIVSD